MRLPSIVSKLFRRRSGLASRNSLHFQFREDALELSLFECTTMCLYNPTRTWIARSGRLAIAISYETLAGLR